MAKPSSFLDIYRTAGEEGATTSQQEACFWKSIAAVRSPRIADTKRAPRGSSDADLFVGRQLIRFRDNEMRRLLDDLAKVGHRPPDRVEEFVLRESQDVSFY